MTDYEYKFTAPEKAASRLRAWLRAGDVAQDKYGYEGAGRALIEGDIAIVLDEIDRLTDRGPPDESVSLTAAHALPFPGGEFLPPLDDIPVGVFWDAGRHNFYDVGAQGMGVAFHKKWLDRCAEFPVAVEAAP